VLFEILRHLKLHEDSQRNNGIDLSRHGFGTIVDNDVIYDAFKRLWTENGDKLSHQYAGTQSNISGVIENGRQGFQGKIA
jgi:hypothetical protein